MEGLSLPRVFRALPFRLNGGLILIYLCSSGFVYYFFQYTLGNYLAAQMDEYLETEMLTITSELDFSDMPLNLDQVRESFTRFGHTHGVMGAFLRLLDQQGGETASSDLRHFRGIEKIVIPMDRIQRAPFVWDTMKLNGKSSRVIFYLTPEGYTLQIGFSLEETSELQFRIQTIFGIALFFILCLGGLLGWFYSQYALRGLSVVRQSAMAIRVRGDLDHRVQARTGSLETDELAETINQMLGRIQDLMRNLTYVMDNIAHDIRTPVTRMRGHAEMQLQNQLLSETEQEMAGQVIEECDQILNLVNILLEITAADSGLFHPKKERCNLADLVRDGCELFEPVWENKELRVEVNCPEILGWIGDPRVFQRVLSNLLDNAIKYSLPGGAIRVHLEASGEKIQLTIRDEGMGIDANEQALIFNRFYRCREAKTQKGNGLGLSYCKSVLEAMGGSIHLTSEPGKGTAFFVWL